MASFCVADFVRLLVAFFSTLAAPHTMSVGFYDCIDLDTGLVIDGELLAPCGGTDWDIYYGLNGNTEPHATLVQNQPRVRIAFPRLPYEEINPSTVDRLYFVSGWVSRPFNLPIVVRTSEGDYYKVELIREDIDATTCGLIGNGTAGAPFRFVTFYTPTVRFQMEQIGGG